MTAGRRIGDAEAHAHQRKDDAKPRLHHRVDDGRMDLLEARMGTSEEIITELMRARFDMLSGLREVKEAVQRLTEETSGVREMEADVTGALRLMARLSRAVGVLWKPLLFVAIAGASVYLWAKGVVAGAWR